MQHQISFRDALTIRAAQVGRADVLYTEDLNGGQIFGSVRAVILSHVISGLNESIGHGAFACSVRMQ